MILNEQDNLIKYIKATTAVEGVLLKEQDISLINKYLHSEITAEEGIDIIKQDIISKMDK